MEIITTIVLLIVGLAIGSLIGWLLAKNKYFRPVNFSEEDINQLRNSNLIAEQRLSDLRSELEERKIATVSLSDKNAQLNNELGKLVGVNNSLQEKLNSQKLELEQLQKQIREQFENIASRIVNENSKLLQDQHATRLNDLLNPLKEKIEKFETTVNTTHKENIRENQSLKEQLKQLQDLNKFIGEEARNLTTALKGQVKTQGNWGEMILESILERSGLQKDREYFIQASFSSEEGRRLQPDVLIRLPENKTIVIDSKVSLIAYEKYVNANTPEEQEAALKEHVNSLRRHIKGLGEKKYQQLYDIKTLDFVLLFVPLEPAFSAAIQKEPGIFNEAFDYNIVIVSTSTLLATLRTIASIWKLEYQNKNALEIARQGGAMFDKFVGFLKDMESVGTNIDSAHRSWDEAMKKLSQGRGNLVTSAEKIKKLGASTTKSLPSGLISDTPDDVDDKPAE